jgi:hypothetical protein
MRLNIDIGSNRERQSLESDQEWQDSEHKSQRVDDAKHKQRQ